MLLSRALLVSFSVLSLLVAGCAQGGGSLVDSGSPPPPVDGGFDAGPGPDVDAGPMMGFDAGPMAPDTGTMGTDAGVVDAGPTGTDAGPMGTDAGFDAGPPPGCTSAAECDDSLACNGIERCIGGTCMAGTPFTCDDAIACTRDTCVEGASPTCRFTADDSLCPSGQTCGGSGCMASCAESPCRLVGPQCGCPSGQGCYLSGASRLCTTSGSTPIGSTCSRAFSCAPGGICINVARSGTAANMCNRFCNSDSDCGGGLCLYTLDDGAGGAVPGVTICSTPCNPETNSGCPSGTACRVLQESTGAMRLFADCSAPIGTGGQGAACAGAEDCRAGFGCLGSPGQCLEWCSGIGFSGSLGGCPTGLFCYGLTTPIVIGGTSYGVCDL
ncbi:MAG: hypothetical protein R3B82_27640 [Sandaracinaceae bacterium]